MTERKLLETIIGKIESMDKRFDQIDQRFQEVDKRFDTMDKRIGQLVLHVAEVRQSNVRLEAAMKQMQDEIRTLNTKIDEKTDFLSSKIDHFIGHFAGEQTRDRTRLEEERHRWAYAHMQTEQRLNAIEQRLERLEAASP